MIYFSALVKCRKGVQIGVVSRQKDCEEIMNRYEQIRRRIRKGRKQKLNTVLMMSIAAAVVLVFVLSVVKMYSHVQNGKNIQSSKQVEQNAQVVPETQAVEQIPVATQTPRTKAVALTFDDGPSRAHDGKILNVLQKYGARATFFVLGDRARVDGDILQMYLAAGCEIGSHSWNHPKLSKIEWERVERQIRKTDKMVSSLTGGYEIKYLRPPYGSISKKMRKKLDVPMILWSLDTLDWKTRNPKKIFREVKQEVKDGDIILMHDIYGTTAEAVEKVVPWLLENGYDVLTVSELMERKGKTLEGGKAYFDAR